MAYKKEMFNMIGQITGYILDHVISCDFIEKIYI